VTTHSPTVDRVVSLLESAGFGLQATSIKIAEVPFQFAAILVGPDRSLDLIVVVDTLRETGRAICQKVAGLSRALDVVGSRRPLTTIIAGPTPPPIVLDELSRSCRVLCVGTPTGPSAELHLQDALAILLPLELPDAGQVVADPIRELQARLSDGAAIKDLPIYLRAAGSGAEAVRAALTSAITAALSTGNRESE